MCYFNNRERLIRHTYWLADSIECCSLSVMRVKNESRDVTEREHPGCSEIHQSSWQLLLKGQHQDQVTVILWHSLTSDLKYHLDNFLACWLRWWRALCRLDWFSFSISHFFSVSVVPNVPPMPPQSLSLLGPAWKSEHFGCSRYPPQTRRSCLSTDKDLASHL